MVAHDAREDAEKTARGVFLLFVVVVVVVVVVVFAATVSAAAALCVILQLVGDKESHHTQCEAFLSSGVLHATAGCCDAVLAFRRVEEKAQG